MRESAFAVTLVRPGAGLPVFEVGAYQYTASWLPAVGDVIAITKAADAETDGPQELLGYVTRIDRESDTPIRVTEHSRSHVPSADDYIVTP